MLTVYPYASLGRADYGWLKARYHFSFARYWNPARMGFGVLRVINDDIVAAGKGFDTHPHDNMEIITYVRSGAISHRDTLGHEGRTAGGDIQVMSAGSGVSHSEYNHETIDTTLYQIWITPNHKDVPPRWESRTFPNTPVQDTLSLLVSGQPEHQGQDVAFIYQDAAIYGGKMLAGTHIHQPIKHQAYILVSAGHIAINGTPLQKGDGAELVNEPLHITALTDAEIVVIDVPREGDE